ncbi:DUF5069 domain-containing protein [Cerasicoccus arenae]|uniref:DUF5069 domain-containing protein n=1 Tax=Cerasicoccus arenae TaxID=424488 RepID=A0A8J3DMI3_9BACT|nr:DUF5069 domain-containing protein [Cerasicoccus arenae]MBK1857814.1 DUF5069 domain-containing protein [Cerasicoccus arenae]GHC11721.1 hypothetical protein GCM10007047_31290 [Cerasicoccus arenae]
MKFVPLIPSTACGPLGVKHLPRLWLKVSLHTQDKLRKDYNGIGSGFDRMTLEALDIEQEAFENYITQERPTYIELEAWVNTHYGNKLDPRKIAALNRMIETYQHSAETRAQILDEAGIADDQSLMTASMLNNIDDWSNFHKAFLE